jgi:hypothetical protein
MNIALIAQERLFAFFSKQFQRGPVATHSVARVAPKFIATYAHSTGATGQFCIKMQAKPLRVVRVVETGQTRNSVGRMVISGRMADVCAELDRLAAREAALT